MWTLLTYIMVTENVANIFKITFHGRLYFYNPVNLFHCSFKEKYKRTKERNREAVKRKPIGVAGCSTNRQQLPPACQGTSLHCWLNNIVCSSLSTMIVIFPPCFETYEAGPCEKTGQNNHCSAYNQLFRKTNQWLKR